MGESRGPGHRRPGPVYDDAMKILADDDLGAVLSLVGVHGEGAERLNVELAGSAVRADLVARTPAGIVHVEFVKDRTPNLDLRMLEYRSRLHSQERDTPVVQYVLVLGDGVVVPDRYVDGWQLTCAWSVVRVGDQDPATLLRSPTTAAIAALGRGTPVERAAVLTTAAALIADAEPDRSRTLLGAAATLASIVLPGSIIETALKEATMPVLVRDTPLGRQLAEEIRQEIREEIRQEIREEVRQEIREEGRQAVVRLTGLVLQRIFGDDPRVEAIAERMAELPDGERIDRLAKATSLDDLDR